MDFYKIITASALPLIAASSMLSAERANQNEDRCQPEPPVMCYPDDCVRCYCLGPENYGVNAPVRPRTCDGDFIFTIAGFYWIAHQDGMEYGISSDVSNDVAAERRNLIDAHYLNPHSKWEPGFKIGVSYATACDGWDFGILWTRYRGKAFSHDEGEVSDNTTLLPLWSNFTPAEAPLYATDITSRWKLDLDLIDIELGREFWTSPKLSIRPFMGVRVALIRQDFDICYRGGSWSVPTTPLNDEVNLSNDFKGAGLRGGLDTVWNLGCGWALYGNMALNLIYGKFDFDHDEHTREAAGPNFATTKILEAESHFRASRFIGDLSLGVQWSALVCDCKYGMMIGLGWEQHIFLNQNQMWRVVKIGNSTNGFENSFDQRRGDLDTQGVTLTFKFDY